MYFLIAKKYIDKLNIDDIKKYCFNNEIEISDDEIKIIYSYIKKYWISVWQNINNIYPIFSSLKQKLSSNVYKKMISLYKTYYDMYYDKYKDYLGH